MTCDTQELLLVSLGLITAISECLALLKGVECNGILDFIIRMMVTRQRCADIMTVETPTMQPPQSAELPNYRIRRSIDRANLDP